MQRRYLGMPGAPVYSGHPELGGEKWHPGDVREVSDEFAAYLDEHFPGAFVSVPGRRPKAEQQSAPSEPPNRADVQSPGATLDAGLLAGAIATVRRRIRAGKLDADLMGYRRAEMDGKARPGVLAALEDRITAGGDA